MTRRFSPHLRLARLQRTIQPLSASISNPRIPFEAPQQDPQVVDRRGSISALIQATPHGYDIIWRLIGRSTIQELDRRGPYPTRALAICWARVGLLLREEAWLSIHGSRRGDA